MVKNKPYGDGCRVGSVKNRPQTHNPKTIHWVKRDIGTGQFIKKSLLLKNVVVRNLAWE